MRGRKRDDVALKSRGSQVKAEAVAPAKSMTNEMFNLRLRENQKKKKKKKEERMSPENGVEKSGKNILVVYFGRRAK